MATKLIYHLPRTSSASLIKIFFTEVFFSWSTFQQSVRVASSFDKSTSITYETKINVLPHHHLPSCINPKVHCVVCAMQVATDLRWQTNGWYRTVIIVGFQPSNRQFTWHPLVTANKSCKSRLLYNEKNIQEEVTLYWFWDRCRENHVVY